jgi:hypothetical protein
MRHAVLALGVLLALPLCGAEAPQISVAEAPNPARSPSCSPAFATGAAGEIWLSWVVPGERTVNTLRFARRDASSGEWTTPPSVIADASVTANAADVPLLGVDGHGTVFALWTDDHGGARTAHSSDRGETWTAPIAWESPGIEVEKFSLAPLADGRLLAAWLDGRNRKANGNRQALVARIVGEPTTSDVIVDSSVCDCCQTSLAPLLDGGALLAFRGRTEDEARDIHVARFRGREWDDPRLLNHDDWRLRACPVNGPQLATDGSRVAAAWFTGADNDPRVLVSYSPDAGERWLMPLRVDRGHPIGHVATALLHDGAILVVWLEADGSLWLERITPDFVNTSPVQLAAPGAADKRGFPRIVLVSDYHGGNSSAEAVVAFTTHGEASTIRLLRVTVPEGALLNAERNCECAPTAEQLQGFAIRGMVVGVDPEGREVRVRHAAVPGVFAAGADRFRVTPTVFATLSPGREFLGRIDRRDGAWWLGELQWLAGTPK